MLLQSVSRILRCFILYLSLIAVSQSLSACGTLQGQAQTQPRSAGGVSQSRDPSRIFEDSEAQRVYQEWVKSARKAQNTSKCDNAEGLASWYGPGLNGNKTASGQIFDMYGQTAAHKRYPFGSIVVVKNKRNQKQVVVRINDRGPFVGGRIIDLSYGAAYVIEMIRSGVEEVEVEVLRCGK